MIALPHRLKQFSYSMKKAHMVLEDECVLFLAEKERFELSRRLLPTYTLSRGASSANLSTSPNIKQYDTDHHSIGTGNTIS